MPPITVFNPGALGAPKSPYSRALRVKASEFVFVAGMAAFDRDGNVVGDGDFDEQCRQVFLNIETALREAGAGWNNVVQFTSFLRDQADIAKFADYRRRHFPAMFTNGNFPPNTLVLAARFSHDAFRLEVQTIAAL